MTALVSNRWVARSDLGSRAPGVAFTRPGQALWTALFVGAYLVAHIQLLSGWRFPVMVVGVLSPVHGIAAFLRAGGSRISSVGIFSLIMGMLLGLGAYPTMLGSSPRQELAIAAIAAVLVQVWATPVRESPLARMDLGGGRRLDPRDTLVQQVALVSFVMAFLSQFILGRGNPWGELLALGAIVLVSIVRATSGATLVERMALPTVLTLAYAALIHSGDGRLRLVSAVFVVMFLGSMLDQGMRLKVATVIGLPAGLFGMAWLRLQHVESIRAGLSNGRSGLESGIVPLEVFQNLLMAQNSGRVEPIYGLSYLSVPSSFLGDIVPFLNSTAIGYELVTITQPDRSGTGFSLAGLAMSEWVHNFGLLTLPVFALLIAGGLQQLDKMLAQGWQALREQWTAFNLFRLSVIVTLFSGIPDFAWGGSHTLFMRVTLRTLPLAVIGLLFALVQRPDVSRSWRPRPAGWDPYLDY